MKKFDVVIIGSGPSGLSCASNIFEKKVLLLEKNSELGGKIKVSGGGRCNVLNKKAIESFLENVPKNAKFLFSTLNKYSPTYLYDYFEMYGLELKEENDNRIFPSSDKSETIINFFKGLIEGLPNVSYKTNYEVNTIKYVNSKYIINNTIECQKLIIATGGITYQHLGTTGFGYEIAKQFGHTIEIPFATEAPLVSNDMIIQEKVVQGISLKNVVGKVVVKNKVVFEKEHDIIFTHFGLSGPLALQSSYYIQEYQEYKPKLILRLDDEYEMKNIIPKKLKQYIDINGEIVIEISDVRGKKHGFVTNGGVNVKEINPRTFESTKQKNLYFIGEVLDVNAFTGGYNISICLAEGFTLANEINN